MKRLGQDLGSTGRKRRGPKATSLVPPRSDDGDLVIRFNELPRFDPMQRPYESRPARVARRALARLGIAWDPYDGRRSWKAQPLSATGYYFVGLFFLGVTITSLASGLVTGRATSSNTISPVLLLVVGLGLVAFATALVLLTARKVSEAPDGTLRFHWIRRTRDLQPGDILAVTRFGPGVRARSLLPLTVRSPQGSFLLWSAMTNQTQLYATMQRHSPRGDLSQLRDLWS
jgi:hypothetical protein